MWRRTALSEVMCASKISAKQKKEQKVMDSDKRFRSKECWRAFKIFLKFFRLLKDETVLSFLYGFDVVVANAADSFKLAVSGTAARDIDKNGETVEVQDTDAERAEENTKICLKGGTFPQESLRRIEELLAIVATNLLSRSYKIVKEEAAQQSADLKTKLSVEFTGIEENH